MNGLAYRGSTLTFGSIGLQAVDRALITSRQIEASRRAIARHVKRKGKLWVNIFPDKPISRRPAEVRMGGGKGAVEFYAAVVLPGRVMFELDGVDEDTAVEALRLAAYKLPIKTTIIRRGTYSHDA